MANNMESLIDQRYRLDLIRYHLEGFEEKQGKAVFFCPLLPVIKTSRKICSKERWDVLVCSVERLEVQLCEVPTDDFNVSVSGEGESRNGEELSA